ncbi:hypothetical protein M3Y99_00414100 [Aphelenchoides fujianensis]|nr:hypothetical protein M3Y99_00414100 [Aphelenchoides fujianensis]
MPALQFYNHRENLQNEPVLHAPLAGREAWKHVTREHSTYGSTIYFLSLNNRVPRPKESFASYRRFVARSDARLRLLSDYSKQLRLIGATRKALAQQVLDEKTLKGVKSAHLLFKLPIRQVIPRSQKYLEVHRKMFGTRESRSKEVNRFLAALVKQPAIRRRSRSTDSKRAVHFGR